MTVHMLQEMSKEGSEKKKFILENTETREGTSFSLI